MASFDVTFLFTKIPSETREIILKLAFKNHDYFHGSDKKNLFRRLLAYVKVSCSFFYKRNFIKTLLYVYMKYV